MKKIFLLLALSSILLACEKDKDKDRNSTGAKVSVYNGKAWSTITVNPNGVPKELSLVLNNDVLNSAPTGEGHHDHAEHSFIIPLPESAIVSTPFKFIMLDWAPSGHDPANVYTVPHFDIHYYMVPPTEVMTFVDPVKLELHPDADYIPVNHIPVGGVPMMGNHWIDLTSPELNGGPFTQTFIYGSYDGKVVFYEPMITLDFLKNTSNFERSIPQPAKVQNTGYYPTKMKVKKKNNSTEIILDGFTQRQAS
jgi:hypothetical protein